MIEPLTSDFALSFLTGNAAGRSSNSWICLYIHAYPQKLAAYFSPQSLVKRVKGPARLASHGGILLMTCTVTFPEISSMVWITVMTTMPAILRPKGFNMFKHLAVTCNSFYSTAAATSSYSVSWDNGNLTHHLLTLFRYASYNSSQVGSQIFPTDRSVSCFDARRWRRRATSIAWGENGRRSDGFEESELPWGHAVMARARGKGLCHMIHMY